MMAPVRSDARGLCFSLGYSLLLSHNILVSFSTLAVPGWVQAVMLLSALILFGGCILRQRFLDLSGAAKIGCVAILGVVSALGSGKLDVLYYAALLFLCRYGEERCFLKADLAARVAVLLGLIYLSGFDVIVNTVFRKHTVREAFAYGGGFNNPNSMGMMLFLVCMDALLLLRPGRYYRGKVLGICTLFTALILLLAGTRTAVVLTILACLLLLLHSYGFFRGERLGRWGKYAAAAMAAVSFLACLAYREGFPGIEGLNTLVTGRLAHLNSFISRHPVTLFGRQVTYLSSVKARELGLPITVCDNVYIYLLHNLGLVPFLGWLALQTRTAADLLRRGRVRVWLLLWLMLLYGFMENTMANVMFFPLIFFCAQAMLPTEGDSNETEK